MSNNRKPKHIQQKLIKSQGEINESTIIVGDFNTPLSEMDRSAADKSLRTELNSTTPIISWI